MKRCLACNELYPPSMNNCPHCGAGPALVDGFCAYAPELAHGGGGFKSVYFSDLSSLEGVNFWFRARNQLIVWALEKYCSDFHSFLEIGCGTGYVLSGISKKFRPERLYGSEIFTEGLRFAATQLPSVNFMQMDARNIPFEEEFDVIGAFDVLEHIAEDERVLSQVHAALKPRGHMLLTVPQHKWLWSPVDEYACHVRRYSASDLRKKIEAAGFQVLRSTSFISILLPAMVVSRFFQSGTSVDKFDPRNELRLSSWLNSMLFQMLRVESWIIKAGINFPIGGSRLVIARRP
jgi:SAM-dependent methyltransferase